MRGVYTCIALLYSFLCVQVVVNNAGLLFRNSVETVTPEEMMESYKVNTMGPLFVVQALLAKGLLPSGSLIATLTSLVCSRQLPQHHKSL